MVDVCGALGMCVNLYLVSLVLPTWYAMNSVDGAAMLGFIGQIEKVRGALGRGVKIRVVTLGGKGSTRGHLAVTDAKYSDFLWEYTAGGWDAKTAWCDTLGRFDVS